MTDNADLKIAASMVHAFMREHERSSEIEGHPACPECSTVFAGFRIHAGECETGRAADAAKLLCDALGGDIKLGARALMSEVGDEEEAEEAQ